MADAYITYQAMTLTKFIGDTCPRSTCSSAVGPMKYSIENVNSTVIEACG